MNGLKKAMGMFVGTHYKMERFCATFLVFVVLLGSLFAMSLKIHVDNQQLRLGTQARYTVSAQFSLSQDGFTVENIYRDSNFTKVFVLLHTSSMANLSTSASDYRMFMTSYEKNHPLTCNPTGAIYVFGNTGYIGLYLADDAGFEPALYDVVLRNTRMIVQGDAETAQAFFSDESYWKYNQLHFYANFAGSDAIIANFLDDPNPDVRDIYVELISESSAAEIKMELNAMLLSMNTYMSTINEYSRRLSEQGLIVPALPASIDGDYVTTNEELTLGNPSVFSVSMLTQSSVTASSQYNITINADDTDVYQDFVAGDKLYLVTDFVFPGGVQFNYQDLRVNDNILDLLLPEGLTYEQWLSTKSTEASQYAGRVRVAFDTWTYQDGTRFAVSTYDVASQAIAQDIAIYEEAVSGLVNLKQSYQTATLFSYLKEDARSRTVATLFSVRSDADTVMLY